MKNWKLKMYELICINWKFSDDPEFVEAEENLEEEKSAQPADDDRTEDQVSFHVLSIDFAPTLLCPCNYTHSVVIYCWTS